MTLLTATGWNDELLERDDALAALAEAFSDVCRGRGRAVLVSGEAGGGKTELVRRLGAEVAGRCRVRTGACDALSTPRPLGPLHDLADPGSRLAELIEMGASPSEVFAALCDDVTGGGEPTVMVIEDLHWADEATLDVVRLLVRRIRALPVLLVATLRSELGRTHPVRSLLGDLATVRDVSRIELPPLTRDAVAAMAMGHEIDPDELHRRTGGNPFFVAEVLSAGGAIVPSTVRDAVMSRVADLPPAALDVLDVIALSPPAAEPWLLDGVLPAGADLVAQCISSGLVAANPRGLSFRHELVRLAVEDGLAPTRRSALHGRILLVLSRRPDLGIDPARLAHHADGASDAAAVLLHAPAAARAAGRAGAFRESAAQYGRALRFAADLDPSSRADLLEGRSRACYLADDQVEAVAVVRDAIGCRRLAGDGLREARALVELADYLNCRGHLGEAKSAMVRAQELIAGSADCRESAHVLEFTARTVLTDPQERVRLAERARAISVLVGDDRLTGHAMVTIGSATTAIDAERGRALLAGAFEWADERGVHEAAARALNAIGIRLMEADRRDEAAAAMNRTIAYCIDHTSDLWRINVLAYAARNALDRGAWDDAAGHVAAVLADPRQSPWPHHEALLVLALLRARRGDPGADDALAAAVAVGVPGEEEQAHLDLAVARAEVAWSERHTDVVEQVTSPAVDGALQGGHHDAAERLSFWRRLAGLDVAHGGSATPFGLGAVGRWQEASDELRRRGRPYEAALAQAEVGDESSLRGALTEFRRLGALPASKLAMLQLRSLGVRGVERGPRPATRQHPAGLTAREVEVVELLSQGLQNGEIAARMVISRRTVDHHVAAIMRKLDARTRRDAVTSAAALGIL